MTKNKQIVLIYLILTVATLAAYGQVGNHEFVRFDDNGYITENSHIQDGITLRGMYWAFTTAYAANWHPLTWISHMLDVQFYGLKPGGHHLTNLLFHIANVLLLFFFLHRTTKGLWQSAFVAALFALHPLHVESVAWVSERKDVLSALFWMLTLIAYGCYTKKTTLKNYLAVISFFTLGLMAKPMLVTLPFVLLLLDYWPLDRLAGSKPAQPVPTEAVNPASTHKRKVKGGKTAPKTRIEAPISANQKLPWASLRPLVLEKIPLIALTVFSCAATYIAQSRYGAVASGEIYAPGSRIANAFVSCLIYVIKTIWPENLAVLYPHPVSLPLWQVGGAFFFLLLVTFLVFLKAKSCPYLPVGWLWFTGTLVPVIGIIQVGDQAMADRYTYIPSIGLFIMAAWGIPEIFGKLRHGKPLLAASAALCLVCISILTWKQNGYWTNSLALFDHTLSITENNYFIYNNRGCVLEDLGNHAQALEDFNRAIRIAPRYTDAHTNRGVVYKIIGNYAAAVQDFDAVIAIDGGNASAYNNRGGAYAWLGNYTRAIEDFDKAIQINPGNAAIFNDRGKTYNMIGNYARAIEDFDRSIELNHEYTEAYFNRGTIYSSLGYYYRAIADFDSALRLNPEYAQAYNNRGTCYLALGKFDLALNDFNKAVDIDPIPPDYHCNIGIAYHNLGESQRAVDSFTSAIANDHRHLKSYFYRGLVYTKLGDKLKAISDFSEVIELDSNYSNAYIKRGLLYAGLGDLQRAINDFKKVIEINPKDANANFNLGLAHGELGDLEQAIGDLDRAIAIDNGYANAYYKRAMIQDSLGREEKALQDMKAAARLGSQEARESLTARGLSW